MNETVSNELRDSVMNEIVLADNQNHICFDCGSKENKWASPYLGIIICYECSSRHRSYGTHISFVRSIDLDKWNMRTLISMKITGNAYTKQKFLELGVPKIGNIYDYQSDIVIKYRSQLEERVREIIENEHPYSNPEEKKEEKKVEEPIAEVKVEEEKPKEEEIKKPTIFDMKTSAKVNEKK